MNLLASSFLGVFLTLSPVNETKAQTQTCYKNCTISEYGVSEISFFEGYSPFVYNDSAGKPTIGHGHLILPGEKFKEPMLPQEARALLLKDIKAKERSVNQLINVPVKQGQFDALVSFVYNIGSNAFKNSTLLKLLNKKEPPEQIAGEFLKWDKITVNGIKVSVRGLYVRRRSERLTFLS